MAENTLVRSALTWFEIPVADFDRARRFYETILETSIAEHDFNGSRIAVFAYEEGGLGGCLDAGSESRPADGGVVVYFDVDGRIDRALELAASAGGRVAVPKTTLPGIGSVAQIIDSEGNRIGLHAKT
jgi:uncharacterized protein